MEKRSSFWNSLQYNYLFITDLCFDDVTPNDVTAKVAKAKFFGKPSPSGFHLVIEPEQREVEQQRRCVGY